MKCYSCGFYSDSEVPFPSGFGSCPNCEHDPIPDNINEIMDGETEDCEFFEDVEEDYDISADDGDDMIDPEMGCHG